jgi:AraC family multidrug resistance transcriptional activator
MIEKEGWGMSLQTMEAMVRWVDHHAGEEPTLEQLAAHVGYSPCYCSAKFREHMGMSYKQYLAGRKLEAGGYLLRHTQQRVTDIALACGFASPEAFTRAFCRRYACTPSQYRKNHRG